MHTYNAWSWAKHSNKVTAHAQEVVYVSSSIHTTRLPHKLLGGLKNISTAQKYVDTMAQLTYNVWRSL